MDAGTENQPLWPGVPHCGEDFIPPAVAGTQLHSLSRGLNCTRCRGELQPLLRHTTCFSGGITRYGGEVRVPFSGGSIRHLT